MLELGCGYGNTAAAAARDGFRVTGVDISGTRLEFAKQYANAGGPGSPRFAHADFYSFEATERFDAVCYWNGFGIGTDADQRRLPRLIRERWLAADGRVIIDVANPLVWAGWAGGTSHRAARPDAGYQHALTERTDFDPVACRFTDTRREQDQPEQRHTQTGRCYTPFPWAQADLLVDGRHNSPSGATSVGVTHIRSGLPVHVDLHVHPVARTPWPTDGRAVFERRPIGTGTLSFDQLNASGPRQPATAKTADEIRKIHLSYVPIAGKYIGRRSPRACQMIRFLGKIPDFSVQDPAAQLFALRSITGDLAGPSLAWLSDAVTSYLDLVEATL
jgi:SAM-dependent methyltransferase